MLVGNTRLYGGIAPITRWARADDGLLDAAIMHRGGLHLLVDGPRVFLRRLRNSPNVDYARVTRVEVATPGIPVQLDGDVYASTPMMFEAVPRALDVIVPAGFETPLLAAR